MEIYLVQQGDSVDSIASKYGISPERLITDNGITAPYSLAVGQTLVITKPSVVYTVKDGDTLEGIAEAFQVTVLQLLGNNPELADRQYLYPGETLVISYDNHLGNLLVSGYAYPYINEVTLRMTLPYLTYMIVFNYRVTRGGNLIGSDDDVAVIETAKAYGVGSSLVVTTFSTTGEADLAAEYEILLNVELQNNLIESLLNILKEKGYTGVNLAFQFIDTTNQKLYLDFLNNVANTLHPAGYSVFLTINPGLSLSGTDLTFEQINYTAFANIADGILLLSYNWGSIERPPIQYSIVTSKSLLDYIVAQVPLEKIRIALPTVAYDWQLPYIAGQTKANALNFSSALALAVQMNAVINYDEASLSAYFLYDDVLSNQHIVWFKDARSIDSSIKILQSYGIEGIGIWNIMYYFHQMWLVINTQYQIKKP
jgi:spore germination protein